MSMVSAFTKDVVDHLVGSGGSVVTALGYRLECWEIKPQHHYASIVGSRT